MRRNRAPRPKEQEWLRLILLVRKLQRSQFAFTQRFDEVCALGDSLADFRSGFGTLKDELTRAHDTLARLELGLQQGLERIELPVTAARVGGALDVRLARLDALARNLRELGTPAAADAPRAAEMGATLAYLQELVASFEGLARRMESAAQEAPLERGPAEAGVAAAADPRQAEELGATLAYLQELVASFGTLAERFELASNAERPVAAPPPARVLEPDEAEALGAELTTLREALRKAELQRSELEAKHAIELTQVADLAQRRSQRAEEELRTKKRGLAELTQQNIALQTELARLQSDLKDKERSKPEPSVLASLMASEETAE